MLHNFFNLNRCNIKALPILALIFYSTLAQAHHPTGNMTPNTVWHAMLSGLGHPIIGLDHLAFVVGIGLMASLQNKLNTRIINAFMLATFAGALISASGISLPFTELGIAISILIIGFALFRNWAGQILKPMIFAACSGLFHGLAYGETIIGAQAGPILAYLFGFILMQAIIVFTIIHATRALIARQPLITKRCTDCSAAVLSLIGLVFVFFALSN